jgi:U3 small nucleolar RNA-associated protein 12
VIKCARFTPCSLAFSVRGVQIQALSASSSVSGDYSGKPEVTCLTCSPRGRIVAAGYSDGMIRLFDYSTMTNTSVLNGHRKAVTSLCFSPNGMHLASGSKDTAVILWDVVAEAGICRFKGHREEITGVVFVPSASLSGDDEDSSSGLASGDSRFIATCSKDTTLKVWDLKTQSCLQTVIGARVELWGLWVSPSGDRLMTVASDNQMRTWSVNFSSLLSSSSSSSTASRPALNAGQSGIGKTTLASSSSSSAGDASGDVPTTTFEVLQPMGSFIRQSGDRGAHIAGSHDGNMILIQSTGKSIECYRRRNAQETRKRILRRLQRHREKLRQKEKDRAAASSSAAAASKDAEGEALTDLFASGAAGGASGGASASSLTAAGDVLLAGTSLAEVEAYILSMETALASSATSTAKGEEKKGGDSSSQSQAAAQAVTANAINTLVTAGDEWELVGMVACNAKVAWCEFLDNSSDAANTGTLVAKAVSGSSNSLTILVTLQTNQMQFYSLPLDDKAADALDATATVTTAAGQTVRLAVATRTIAQQGHRSDVRAVAVSSDSNLVLTGSLGQAKLWNAKTGSCLRTFDLGSDSSVALSVAFGPGDRHALVGTKQGDLLLFDLASGDLLERHSNPLAAAAASAAGEEDASKKKGSKKEDASKEAADPGHEGAIWSIAIRPDGKGCATGSADKSVRFWDFDLKAVSLNAPGDKEKDKKKASTAAAASATTTGPTLSQLTLLHTRTLKLSDEVLCIKYSYHKDPTKLLFAAALLDTTVRVFFEDTLKFSLSLYGHKLPVMAMDISADSTLLITASADKNVKIWGLDFGDCHRSMFAHQDSVMAISFIANTHLFVTAGKDKVLKYWDADHFECISTMEGHKGEAWAVAVARDGSFIASGSHDRSLRLWRRSDEQVFLEEEKEREMDSFLASRSGQGRDPDGDDVLGRNDEVGAVGKDGTVKPLGKGDDDDANGPAVTAPLPGMDAGVAEASGVVAHATTDTSRGTDRLLEALQLASEETDKWTEYAQDVQSAQKSGDMEAATTGITPPPRNPLLLGLTPAGFILRTLRNIRPSDVDQVLLMLPFADAVKLLKYLILLLRHGQGVEIASKAALLILQVHHSQISSTKSLQPLVTSLQEAMLGAVSNLKNRVGFNMAGLKFLDVTAKTAIEAAGSSFGDGSDDAAGGAGKGAHAEIRFGKRRNVAIF